MAGACWCDGTLPLASESRLWRPYAAAASAGAARTETRSRLCRGQLAESSSPDFPGGFTVLFAGYHDAGGRRPAGADGPATATRLAAR